MINNNCFFDLASSFLKASFTRITNPITIYIPTQQLLDDMDSMAAPTITRTKLRLFQLSSKSLSLLLFL